MARIRTIKPEFWTHEGLSALPEATHLLAAALLNYADDEGYFNANPALIKAACSPLREPSVSIHESLILLSNEGYLELGDGPNGRRYGRIVEFLKHQKVNRPTPSKIKDLPIVWKDSVSTHGEFTEPSLAEQGTGNREQGTKKHASENRTRSTPRQIPIPIPQSWQPNADNIRWMREAGMSQQERERTIGEFRQWALNSGRRVVNWDLAFSRNPAVKGAVGRAISKRQVGVEVDDEKDRRNITQMAAMLKVERAPDEEWSAFRARVIEANNRRLERLRSGPVPVRAGGVP